MTLTDLYRKVLEKLQVSAAEEPVDAGDVRVISGKYAALHPLLEHEGLCNWGPTEDVPEAVVIPLTAMLAWSAASEFGRNVGEFAAEGALGLPLPSLAERQLRRYMAGTYVSTPAQTEYF